MERTSVAIIKFGIVAKIARFAPQIANYLKQNSTA